MSQRGWGRRRCARFLAAHEISERKLPRDLTVRQREQLSAEVDRVSGQRPAIDPILLQVRKLSGGQKWQPVATDGSEAKRIAREQPAVVVACVRVGDRIAVSDAHQAEPVTSRTSRRTGAGVAQLDRVDLAACECQYKPYPGGTVVSPRRCRPGLLLAASFSTVWCHTRRQPSTARRRCWSRISDAASSRTTADAWWRASG